LQFFLLLIAFLGNRAGRALPGQMHYLHLHPILRSGLFLDSIVANH
jgi:hypothetical protein